MIWRVADHIYAAARGSRGALVHTWEMAVVSVFALFVLGLLVGGLLTQRLQLKSTTVFFDDQPWLFGGVIALYALIELFWLLLLAGAVRRAYRPDRTGSRS